MRCLTISERLRKLGANVEYVIRDHPGNINEQIQEKGFKVNLLSSPTANNKQQTLIGYEKWLGVKQLIDAAVFNIGPDTCSMYRWDSFFYFFSYINI